jgi:hypothetical protein
MAKALVAAGASRAEASTPLREAHAVATRIGARPLLRELGLLAERARLDLASPDTPSSDGASSLADSLSLTPREAEVLTLVADDRTPSPLACGLRTLRFAGLYVVGRHPGFACRMSA